MVATPPSPEDVVQSIPKNQLLGTDIEILARDCLRKLGWPDPPYVAIVGDLQSQFQSGTKMLNLGIPVADSGGWFKGKAIQQNFGMLAQQTLSGDTKIFSTRISLGGTSDTDMQAVIRRDLERMNQAAKQDCDDAQTQAEQEAHAVLHNLRELISYRIGMEQVIDQAKTDLGIPIEPTAEADPIRLEPRGLDLDAAMDRAAAGVPQRALDEAIRNEILRTISSFSTALERLPETAKKLATLGEESFRDVLLFIINSRWKTAAGEAFSGRGKTDIMLWFENRVAFTAELKVYSGPAIIKSAVDQLCSYLVWRDTHAALIILIKDRQDVQQAIDAAEQAVADHPRSISRPDKDGDIANFVIRTDDERTVSLALITVPLSTHA